MYISNLLKRSFTKTKISSQKQNKIMNGIEMSNEILNYIHKDYSLLKKVPFKTKTNVVDRTPKLAIVQIGNKSDSNLFIRNKLRACKKLEFEHSHFKMDQNISKGIF
jgi:methylenetetrahydrofolate dehydrogenase (NADP+)/methenyltetrahydrofolate cyclohydrolase